MPCSPLLDGVAFDAEALSDVVGADGVSLGHDANITCTASVDKRTARRYSQVMEIAEHATAHRPDPVRTQSRCRVNCSCGWRGPLVSMFGEGHIAWVEHFDGMMRLAELVTERDRLAALKAWGPRFAAIEYEIKQRTSRVELAQDAYYYGTAADLT